MNTLSFRYSMIRKSQETPNKHKWKKDSSSDEIKLPIRKPKKTVLETVIGAALGEKKMQTIKESIIFHMLLIKL